ncbi:alpha/beta fold hydrolase [Candidatus Viridilinea mediisalina]|uniref:Alpha/beta hydrolase n=1 Tax=Candidatus Viridilinea mediisalina TaxID=2024553 RepID=A0A2A6RK35_9CHLR|nr:alpha/beta fold hydrolase [Candidatus Viridilinea mediisalina]PDW03382.1 alpha/beta hydrolase [Candidatus Viridilinea mediisalina]
MDATHAALSPFDLTPIRDLYPFHTARLPLPGATMSYVDEGAGPPVLLVHGNPTWSFYFRHLIAGLRPHQRVIVPDHIGCGLSDKPQDYPYRLATHIENLGRLVDHVGLQQVDLVVHDWGGAIGMGWAVRNPERVRRIVVLNTSAFLSPRLPWRIAVCRYPIFGDLAVRGLNAFALAATVMAAARPLAPAVRQGYLLPFDSWANRVAIQRFVRDIPMSPKHPTWALVDAIDRELPTLCSKPMLILWGGQDWCFSDHFLAGWMQRFPDAEVVRFDYAAHYVLEDAHAEAVPRVVRFLGKDTETRK